MSTTVSQRIEHFFSQAEAYSSTNAQKKGIALSGCIANSVVVLVESIGFFALETILSIGQVLSSPALLFNYTGIKESLSERMNAGVRYESQAITTLFKQYTHFLSGTQTPKVIPEKKVETASVADRKETSVVFSPTPSPSALQGTIFLNFADYLDYLQKLTERAVIHVHNDEALVANLGSGNVKEGREELLSQLCQVPLANFIQLHEILSKNRFVNHFPEVNDSELKILLQSRIRKIQELSEEISILNNDEIEILSQKLLGKDDRVSDTLDAYFRRITNLSGELYQGPLMTTKDMSKNRMRFQESYDAAIASIEDTITSRQSRY